MKIKFKLGNAKVVKKAYWVWVSSMIGEYPIFKIEDLPPIFADNPSQAKSTLGLDEDKKNELGEVAKWTDIRCRRARIYDKIEYNGKTLARHEFRHVVMREIREKKLLSLDPTDHYYVQDARSYVGNSMIWWAKGGNGYTTDLSKAHRYTKEEVLKQFKNGRDSDIIWSARHIENNVKFHVDVQSVNSDYAI